jgi:hypothetical protein
MDNGVLVLKEDGRTKVKITNDGYGLELYTMHNGFQWTGQGVDEKILRMIREAIDDYLMDTK